MIAKLLLYARADCCLCEEMKATIQQVAAAIPLDCQEIDVDGSPHLIERFGAEVPVLFIDGRKAFKHRVTTKQLERRLHRNALWSRMRLIKREG